MLPSERRAEWHRLIVAWAVSLAVCLLPAVHADAEIGEILVGPNVRLESPRGVAVDGAGNVFVGGFLSSNVFKITSAGDISEIMDLTGDGAGHSLSSAGALATDAAGNVYVASAFNATVFKITPAGVIGVLIDASGDGLGNRLDEPRTIAAASTGHVYVAVSDNDNAFRIAPAICAAHVTAGGRTARAGTTRTGRRLATASPRSAT